jgi:hypothetical protein
MFGFSLRQISAMHPGSRTLSLSSRGFWMAGQYEGVVVNRSARSASARPGGGKLKMQYSCLI